MRKQIMNMSTPVALLKKEVLLSLCNYIIIIIYKNKIEGMQVVSKNKNHNSMLNSLPGICALNGIYV